MQGKRISVIIPTLDEEERIGGLIDVLRDGGFDDIIVADGASDDSTVKIARARGAEIVEAARGRGSQLRAGAAAATGDVLFFLHADCTPPEGARAAILETLSAPGVAAGSFSLAFDCPHALLRFYGAMSRLNHGLLTYGDQGLFLTRAAYARVGGFSAVPLFEDVDILRRLRRIGRVLKRPEPMMTSARRFLRDGMARRELKNVALVTLYHCGAPPRLLARWYGAARAARE